MFYISNYINMVLHDVIVMLSYLQHVNTITTIQLYYIYDTLYTYRRFENKNIVSDSILII